MSKPLVSIIIPVWNTSDTVRHMISSVLAQSFEDYELILVDDGSTDDTLSVLQAIEKSDKRVRVFTKANGGPSSARNLGLEKAQGFYIQFYDGDDNIDVDALKSVTSTINGDMSDLIVSGWQIDLQSPDGLIKGYKYINPPRQIVDTNIPTHVIRSLGQDGTLYNLWNKLFRADIIRDNHLRFREDLRFGEDLLFSLEYMRYVTKISIIPDITYHYQVNSGTSVFASSSLVPEYRTANDEGIVEFAKGDDTPETSALLTWLRWRWLMSYWSLVAASKKAIHEKVGLIRDFKPKKLSVSYSINLLGLKKITLQMAASLCRRNSYLALGLGMVLSTLKRVIVMTKTQLRRLSSSQR